MLNSNKNSVEVLHSLCLGEQHLIQFHQLLTAYFHSKEKMLTSGVILKLLLLYIVFSIKVSTHEGTSPCNSSL